VVLLLSACGSHSNTQAQEQDFDPRPAAAETSPEQPAVPNFVTIYSNDTKTSQPYTISRVFARGEFPRYVQASIKGSAVQTQCNVKNRWPDGSVKHALLSFWAVVPSSSGLRVDFIAANDPSSNGYLTKEAMLSNSYDFSGVMTLTHEGDKKTADARAMLQDGAFRYWLRGPVCTQVIIEDRSPQLRYDIGWGPDQYFHPIFVATFYPGWRGVKVEFIGENAWTTHLQPLTYSLSLSAGPLSEMQTVYQREFKYSTGAGDPSTPHFPRTRWRKVYWSGQAPNVERVDFNLPYLIYSRAIPNFDTSIKLSSTAIDSEWNDFSKTDKGEINGSGQWLRNFSTTGGRPDIGLFPRWTVRYLYSFDKRLYDVMIGNAAVSGYIPIHYRESKEGVKYRKGTDIAAFGWPVSLDARPTIWINRSDWEGTRDEDRITAVAASPQSSGWSVDLAHQGSFVYIPYLVTGDWYYLEELYFWASYNLSASDPDGRHADWGYLNYMAEQRGIAWGLRTVGHAAFMAPDGFPAKDYFREKLENNIAVHEGMMDIRDGAFYDPTPGSRWWYGRNAIMNNRTNPLNYMDQADEYSSTDFMDKSASNPCRVQYVGSPWMQNFTHIVFGHLEELGFPIHALRERMAWNLIEQILSPDYNPYLIAAYRIPMYQAGTKTFYQDWGCVLQAYQAGTKATSSFDAPDPEHGYNSIAWAAASFLPGIFDVSKGYWGKDAWAWVTQHFKPQDAFQYNPKWALVPRNSESARSAEQSSPRTSPNRGRSR